MKSSIRAIAAVSLLILASRAAHAGDDAGATGPAAPAAQEVTGGSAGPRTEGLQEVLVTAQRREEELSRVPISVTALTQADIDQKGIKDFLDIARFTPGVSIDNSATNAISIRGISSSAGAGTTGIYIDETPIQMRSVGFNPDDALPKTFDIERVEVLRGPQGTLFGAGAEGGAVRYILTQPNLNTASSYLRSEVSYTQYGAPNYELGIARGQPIVDGTFGVRASVWYRWEGGWVDRVDPTTRETVEKNINRGGTLLARLAATWQPTSSFSLTPSILYQDMRKHDDSTYWPAYSDAGAGHFNTATPELIPNYDKYYLPALKVMWDLGRSQIIGDASYYHRDQTTAYQGTVYDLSYYQYSGLSYGYGCVPTPATTTTCPGPPGGLPLIDGSGMHIPSQFGTSYATPNVMTNSQENYAAELRWQSSDSSARLNWTTGVFWQLAKQGSLEELKDPQINAMYNYLYATDAISIFCPPGPPGGPATCPGPPDFVNSSASPAYSCPTNVAYPAIPACDIYYNNNTTFDRQIAIYGELSYAFTDWFRLTVGERFSFTEFSLTHRADGLENFGPYSGIPSMPSEVRASQKENPNTPKVVASFQVDPKNLFYASYAKGFRVGGGNAPLPPYCDQDLANAGYPHGAPLTYRSDSTQNYEIGSKNTIGENLRIATSVYYIKWNDIQQNLYVAGACGLQFTDNLGTAAAWGGDLQAELALGQMHFDLATGYTSARYTKDSPAGCTPYQIASPGVIPCKTSNGNAISGQAAIDYAPGTNPPFTVALGAEYTFRLAEHAAFARADWTYQSRNPWLAALQDPRNGAVYNPFAYTLPATSFTTVRAGMYLGEWQISLFVDNLFGSARVTNYAQGQPSGAATVQENDYTYRPRTFGINANWRVGSGTDMSTLPQATSATAEPVSAVSAHRCAQAVAAQRAGHALSREFYCDAELFEREVRQLILRHWHCVGHHSQVREPGDFFTTSLCGEPLLVVRGQDREVRALLNVCRHRGSRVCTQESGHARGGVFVCPYHAWSYGFDGRLRAARHMPEEFDRASHGLRAMHTQVLEGLIFVSFADTPLGLEHVRAALAGSARQYGWARAKVAHRETYPVRANWKLAVENYMECYHCGPAHEEYSRFHLYSRPAPLNHVADERVRARARALGVAIEEVDHWGLNARPGEEAADSARSALSEGAVTGSEDGRPLAPLMGGFSDYDGGVTFFDVGLTSNFLAYPDHGLIYRFIPNTVQSTDMEVLWLVREDARAGVDYDLERLTWLWKVTSLADKRIIELNQQGVNSRFYQPGPYTPMERHTRLFVEWILKELQ